MAGATGWLKGVGEYLGRLLDGFLGATWILASLLPGTAAVASVLAYILLPQESSCPAPGLTSPCPTPLMQPADPWQAIAIGVTVAVLVWLLAAIAWRPMTRVSRAQPRVFRELEQRYETLRAREATLDPSALTRGEVKAHLDAVESELHGDQGYPRLRWALAHGYVGLNRSLHRAEEAILSSLTASDAVGESLHDYLSLSGSRIGSRQRLERLVRVALHRLNQQAEAALLPASAQPIRALRADADAVATLREVRHEINVYRDDRQDELIRARNRLLWTILAVGVTAYLALGLALITGVPTTYVVGASAFYLVAAATGLFDRLRREASRSEAVEDYGYHQARLVATALTSGLAGVAGVYLVAATANPGAVTLANVFDLAANQLGLLVAAVFGLSPSLVINHLQRQAERLEGDLSSSAPSTGGGATVQDEHDDAGTPEQDTTAGGPVP